MSESKRFQFNPAEVSAGPLVLDDGEYLFLIEDVTSFLRERTNATTQETDEVYGVTARCKIVEGDNNIGKSIFPQFFMHTESTGSMNKAFLLAAYGYDKKAEAEFNETIGKNADFNIDFDAKIVGDGWKDLVGRNVRVFVKTKPQKGNDAVMQNQFTWVPA